MKIDWLRHSPRWKVGSGFCGSIAMMLAGCGSASDDASVGAIDASPQGALDAGSDDAAHVGLTDGPEGGDGADIGMSGPPPFTDWPRDAIFYHLYLRSFADSNGDGKGDLPGLISKLDYIKSLGVDGVLMLPIFKDDQVESGGYGTVDYGHVSDDYGGDAAFDALVREAHARGLKVLLDLSLTLVSASHPWFVAAKANPAAPERAHFLLNGPPCPNTINVANTNGWYPLPDGPCFYSNYAATFPNLNYRDPSTSEAAIAAAEHWLDLGADGFRLDSAAEIASVDPAQPVKDRDQSSAATHAFWRPFVQRMKNKSSRSFAVAELFDHEADYFADGIDMAFQYRIFFGLVDAWTNASRTLLAYVVADQVAQRPAGAMGAFFTGNHDVPGSLVQPGGRIADVLCPHPCSDPARLRAAAMMLFSLPGTPFVYYGEEIGLHGAPDLGGKTLWSRNPMQWDTTAGRGFTGGTPWTSLSPDSTSVAAQDKVSGSMLETYRGLIQVRRTSPALTHGNYRELKSDRQDVFAYLRQDPSERVLVVANLTPSADIAKVNLADVGIMTCKARERILGAPLAAVDPGNASAYPVTLSGYGVVWIALE